MAEYTGNFVHPVAHSALQSHLALSLNQTNCEPNQLCYVSASTFGMFPPVEIGFNTRIDRASASLKRLCVPLNTTQFNDSDYVILGAM